MLQQQIPLSLYTLSHRTFYTAYTTKAFFFLRNTLYYHCYYQHLKHYYHEHYHYQSQQFQITVLTQ